ncbi:MAG: hypothetical protein LBH43_15160, partial [Treponema sp.]|nr:hypothetical protein [Treponema sp.]
MLITEIGEIEDISDCFMYFPQFNDDFNILYSESIIKHTAFNRYDWTKSKTSLAEYFHWVGNNASYVTGGFWAPVAKTFTVKGKPATKRQLAKLAGNNANDLKPEESKD